MSPIPTVPELSFQHSAQVTNEFTLLDPRVRESLYEKLPSRGRPLSYAEILRCWAKAVIKRQRAVHSMEEAQEEYEDHASDIIAVVGQDVYNKFLENLLGALRECSSSASAEIRGHSGFRKENMLNSSHARATSQLLTPCHSSHTSVHQTMGLEVVAPRTGIMIYDHRVCEALYERLPSHGRPLSYAEILRRWTKAVIKRNRAVHSAEETQDEYEDSASDVIAVIGQEEYYKFLEVLSSALQKHWMVVGGEVNEVA
ncbi:hypothetical protein EDD15DRAFT_2373404 [Pisolithus albus]|nr:hypothetical protein EDD15DRAFT_2373404 [Pisolithus albus]